MNEAMTAMLPPRLEAMLLEHEVAQFLYEEAALLDGRRYDVWLGLLDDDLDYWMPIRSTRSQSEQDLEFTQPGQGAFFDDDKSAMAARVAKLATGYSWAEDPPSRTRRLITNVRIAGHLPGEPLSLRVESNFIIYRSRLEREEDLWAGRREDTLRKVDGQWRIARRHIFLDHVSLLSNNLSIFF